MYSLDLIRFRLQSCWLLRATHTQTDILQTPRPFMLFPSKFLFVYTCIVLLLSSRACVQGVVGLLLVVDQFTIKCSDTDENAPVLNLEVFSYTKITFWKCSINKSVLFASHNDDVSILISTFICLLSLFVPLMSLVQTYTAQLINCWVVLAHDCASDSSSPLMWQ